MPTKAKSLPPARDQAGPVDRSGNRSARTKYRLSPLAPLSPLTNYDFQTPDRSELCEDSARSRRFTTDDASVTTNLTWEAQLLAELNYLPLTFTPGTPQSDPSKK